MRASAIRTAAAAPRGVNPKPLHRQGLAQMAALSWRAERTLGTVDLRWGACKWKKRKRAGDRSQDVPDFRKSNPTMD